MAKKPTNSTNIPACLDVRDAVEAKPGMSDLKHKNLEFFKPA